MNKTIQLTDSQLRGRMDRIMATLGRLGLRSEPGEREGQVEPLIIPEQIDVTPTAEVYRAWCDPRVLDRVLATGPQLALALGEDVVEVKRERGRLAFRVPRPTEQRDTVTYAELWPQIEGALQPGQVLLGAKEDGTPFALDLGKASNVHAAVIGMTGSGKSTLMRAMILSAQQTGGARVVLMDPSGGFRPLSGHPSVWRGLFADPESIEAGLRALAGRIGQGAGKQPVLCFVDEVPHLAQARPGIKAHLASLAEAGRHAGIHLVLGAQHPLSSELGPTTMRNVPVRLVGHVADHNASYNATGLRGVGCEGLKGNGEFIAVTTSGTKRFQAAYLSDKELAAWAKQYSPRVVRVRLAEPVPLPQGGGGEGGRPTDDIPQPVLAAIRRYRDAHGKAPSPYWVRTLTRKLLGAEFRHDKAKRAIVAALGLGAEG